MPFVPSADLLRQINLCPECTLRDPAVGREGLCEVHRVRWNLELCTPVSLGDEAAESLDRIMRSVLSTESGARQLLSAMNRQVRALQLVWEAHERGAIRLPDRVAESVRQARVSVPSHQLGSTQSAIKQAS
ncbi:MAG TPA: hypothetical protein VMH39_02925 [Gemmatimonadaceae bacterium]|nr:hypothetical protein [Gemmatimonadaceae bacterium]